MRPDYTPSFIARFWSHVDRSNPAACWLWGGRRDRHHIISFQVNGKGCGAGVHRVAWELTNGLIADDLWVLHNCPGGDNPSCINPAHLWLGTSRDNIDDMVRKGRQAQGSSHISRVHPERMPRGERHGQARLSEREVLAIRAQFAAGGVNYKQLANLFRVSDQQVARIVRRKCWSHI